jgi:hypothetical protein
VPRKEVSMSDKAVAGQEFVDSLEHYGVLGMKWGVTKARISGAMNRQEAKVAAGNAKRNAPKDVTVDSKLRVNKYKTKAKGGEKQTPSDDAVESVIARRKLKKSGMDSLSNQELKDLSTRLNLEIQVSTLSSKRPRSAKDKFVNEAMKEANKDPVKTAEKGAEALEWLRKKK